MTELKGELQINDGFAPVDAQKYLISEENYKKLKKFKNTRSKFYKYYTDYTRKKKQETKHRSAQ